MITSTVEHSWDRIESWLARHAPVTHRLLRPPALLADIAATELRLGVAFPPDLRESLLRHDGVELQDGTLRLDYYGPPSGVGEILRSTEFLREVGQDIAEEEADLDEEERDEHAYWPRERLLITLGIGWQSSDGLFLVTRPGLHHGRVGRYFDRSGRRRAAGSNRHVRTTRTVRTGSPCSAPVDSSGSGSASIPGPARRLPTRGCWRT
ncbi:SMI1/KNR4 family protein [Kitasatospora purpeofusca]|uniref:SMI1/KNR4 family protein n=1 Tax=Kitasatospora purpeofusca TaxID=67352 RepID=UPI00324F52F5